MRGSIFGRTVIEGLGAYSGKKVLIDYRNENMIAWDEAGNALVMVPTSYADIEKGMKVAVVAIPAPKGWREHPRGFDVWRHILEKMWYERAYKPLSL